MTCRREKVCRRREQGRCVRRGWENGSEGRKVRSDIHTARRGRSGPLRAFRDLRGHSHLGLGRRGRGGTAALQLGRHHAQGPRLALKGVGIIFGIRAGTYHDARADAVSSWVLCERVPAWGRGVRCQPFVSLKSSSASHSVIPVFIFSF